MAGGDDEPAAETLCRSAAERETEVMHNTFAPGGAPGIGAGEIRTQPFGEDLGWAATCGTAEAADADLDDSLSAGDGQVR
ncbi:hypothetical protein Maq22A_2p41050 (plasmid) [Methylobacterium aquaticum]|uniref:Uncharacterized protein n=1 Tax=Methylobacterium aquaticum TaxID=270351 RepID=A0A0C6FSE7_9HYPH|nr:hypothetical protein Maq22A_2p41050 [Methylobacterium aquaticum]